MSRTSDIDWKRLEEKPENWEMIQTIIADAIGMAQTALRPSKGKDTNRKQEAPAEEETLTGFHADPKIVLQHLVRSHWASKYGSTPIFQKTEAFLRTSSVPAGGRAVPSTKVRSMKKIDRIRLENAGRMILKDIDKIHFDKGVPTVFQFQFDMTFVIMILEWWALLESLPQSSRRGTGERLWMESLVAGDRVFRRLVDASTAPIAAWMRQIRDHVRATRRTDECLASLFANPRLMMYSVAEKCRGVASLYDSQKELIGRVVDAVVRDAPILLGNRMPPGTGKTFLAVPLAQAVQALHRPKTVLFCCPNILVREYVGSLALLGHDLHLWMGCYTRSSADEEFYMIRPHKRCFPSIWKKIYKEEAAAKYSHPYQQIDYYIDKTHRQPDILICDPKTCIALLSDPSRRDMFIAYVDEIIGNDDVTRTMTTLLYHLPRHSIVMSAILPHFRDIPFLTEHFTRCHPDAQIHMVDASGVTLSCSMIGPDGRLNLPHHFIQGLNEIPALIGSLETDPLIRRMYAPSNVLDMAQRILAFPGKRAEYTDVCDWWAKLPAMGCIEYHHIIQWWIDILRFVFTQQDTLIWDLLTSYRPLILPERPGFVEMFSQQASLYPGKHLHIFDNDTMYTDFREMGARHLEGSPSLEMLVRKRDTAMTAMMASRDKIQSLKVARLEKDRLLSEWSDEYQSIATLQWPPGFVMNSRQHFYRFHKSSTPLPPGVGGRQMFLLGKDQENMFDETLEKLMISGAVLYEERDMTEYQRRTILRVMNHMNFIMSGEEIVFGTNIEGLTGLSIDRRFGLTHHRSILYQLIGRTGRKGMSYQARVIVDSQEVLDKIMRPARYESPLMDPDIRAIRTAWDRISSS